MAWCLGVKVLDVALISSLHYFFSLHLKKLVLATAAPLDVAGTASAWVCPVLGWALLL